MSTIRLLVDFFAVANAAVGGRIPTRPGPSNHAGPPCFGAGCRYRPPMGGCNFGSPCAPGFRCQFSQCVPVPNAPVFGQYCSLSRPCPAGQACDNFGRCINRGPRNPQGSSSADCPIFFTCDFANRVLSPQASRRIRLTGEC